MANGEWLTQLMAGLGGAFTGESMARERIAQEQEAERKRQEAENERERLRQIQELRGQPYSEANAARLLGLGDTPQSVAALKDMFTPKTQRKPLIEGVGKDNRRYTFDPNTGETTFSPVEEYRAPREPKSEGPTASDIRSARSELRGAEAGFRSVLGSRPRQSQYIDPLTRLPDTTAFQRAEQSWRPESTYAAERRKTAGEELQALLGTTGGIRGGGMQADSRMPQTAAAEQAEAREVQQAIARVMASNVSDAEKQAAVKAINDEFQKAILEIRSGR